MLLQDISSEMVWVLLLKVLVKLLSSTRIAHNLQFMDKHLLVLVGGLFSASNSASILTVVN